MKKKQIEVRSLCGICKSNYESSGYRLTKIGGQQIKDDCDICQVRKGWEYKVVRKDGGA